MPFLKKLKYGFSMLSAELKGETDYWHVRERALLPEESSPNVYFLDMKAKGFYPGELENGVPVFYYNGKHRGFFPITVLNYGLGLLNRRQDGEDVNAKIKDVLRFLLDTQCEDGAWRYELPSHMSHEMSDGKVSGMTQGLALSFLIRCHRIGLLSEEDCKKVVLSAKNLMLSSLCVSLSDGQPFIEEFSVPGASILNGSLFALLGLYDYCVFTDDKQSFETYEEALRQVLSKFCFCGGWCYYDRQKTICSKFYQQLHIDLMQVFAQITGNAEYIRYQKKWQKGLRFSSFFVLLKAAQKALQMRKWSMNAHSKQSA